MPEIGPGRDPESLLAHSSWVRGLVRALVLDPGQGDDIVQQTWLAAIEAPRRHWLDPRAWLGGVARNLAREANRRDARRARREERSARPERLPSTDELAEKAELQRCVAKAVLELDEPYRSTLLLRYFGELSAEEIAQREGLPSSTVRNRLKHGLDRLRQRFDREHGGDRRAWVMGFVPLVRPGGGAAAGSLASSTASISMIGGSIMLSKIWIAAAAALVVAGGTAAVLLRPGLAPNAPAPAASLAPPAEEVTRVAHEAELWEATQPLDVTRTAAETVESANLVRGVLFDQGGRPLAGAEVFVGGWRNPFGAGDEVALQVETGRLLRDELDEIFALDPEALRREGLMRGRILTTDAAGAFEARLPEAGRVWVQVGRTVGVQPLDGAEAWHETPAREIALTARRIPTAALSIRVLDETTAEPLPRFEGVIRERRPPGAAQGNETTPWVQEFAAGAGGSAEIELEIEGGPEEYDVKLVEPPWARAGEVLQVAAGAHAELALVVRSGEGFSGEVTDELGNAVEGALVFWGDLLPMRAHNSLTGAFHTECAPDPVRTDARGRFVLPGRAELVSAWHAELSPTTVSASEASSLRLPPRGGLRGRVVDDEGRPVAGERVELDRERSTTTDATGAWSFERLEAGLHDVDLPLDRWVLVRVPPGEVLEVDVDWIGDATVQLLAGGTPYHEPFGGVIVGSGAVFLLREFETEEGMLGLWNAIPDRYHLISRSGRIAKFEVSGTSVIAELGDADLTVHATPGDRVYLVPEGADDALEFWSRRMSVETPASGATVWKPLARGRWHVATEDRGRTATVEVTGPGAEVTVD
jgi:RNA polymerase sigma-70 factor (ECF subfamily)